MEQARIPGRRAAPAAERPGTLWRRLLPALLVALVLIAFAPALRNGFVNYDDDFSLTENPRLQAGLTWESARWAFTSLERANWFPLTWLSHLLDVSLFGFRPAGHHAVGLALHALNALLLFLILRAMTGEAGRSLLVAALFALHPLRVESVAWASSRKDLLSGLFWLAAAAAHVRYARRPSLARYLPLLVACAAALMSKPVAVTLPFTLLLLDWWPLGRWRPGAQARASGAPAGAGAARLLLEKLPLFALSAAASAFTYAAQNRAGAVSEIEGYTPQLRAGGAILAYVRYLAKTFWPGRLSVLYFYHQQENSLLGMALGGALLAALTMLLVVAYRRRGYLATGWLWFLGVLVPMIGFVQVGSQGMADRYTYVPHIGLFLALVWGGADLVRVHPRLHAPALGLCAVLLLACTSLTFAQTLRWRNTVTLFSQAVESSPENWIAQFILGQALSKSGDPREADRHLQEALRGYPRLPQAHLILGLNAFHRGDRASAVNHFAEELELDPGNVKAHFYLGTALAQGANARAAKEHFEAVLRLDPRHAGAHVNLGLALAEEGNWAEALRHFLEALRINPADGFARAKAQEMSARLGAR